MPNNQPTAWAFAVNYHAAEEIAALARDGNAKLWANIEASTFKGEAQNLYGEVTGTDLAHCLLYTSPSPRDRG